MPPEWPRTRARKTRDSRARPYIAGTLPLHAMPVRHSGCVAGFAPAAKLGTLFFIFVIRIRMTKTMKIVPVYGRRRWRNAGVVVRAMMSSRRSRPVAS